jgi:MraZ protein
MERMDRISFLKGAARVFQRHTYGGASLDSLSPEGRMKVPDHLRRYAQLKDEVVLVGVATRLEVWNPKRWKEEESALKEQAEQVSETLSECGI